MSGLRRISGRQVLAGFALTAAVAAPAPLASGLQERSVVPAAVDLWLHPLADARIDEPFRRAVDHLTSGRPASARPAFAALVSDGTLGGYALLYAGRSALALEQASEAAATARRLLASRPSGALEDAAWWLLADASEAGEDWGPAREALRALAARDTSRQTEARLRLGQAALRLGNRDEARDSFQAIYYDRPATVEAAAAAGELSALKVAPAAPPSRELARAEQLFSAGRYTEARQGFLRAQPKLDGEEASRAALRLVQSDLHLRRHTAALAAIESYLARADARVVEAEFTRLEILRALNRDTRYIAEVRRFADRHGAHPLVEAALNELGTFYILTNDDELAAGVFREMHERFPSGGFADRAAWKAGWWAYKQQDYPQAIAIFDAAAGALRRADPRPAWLYWSARSHERMGRREAALDAHQRVVTDYRNLFYGRQSLAEMTRLGGARVPVSGSGAGLQSFSAPIRPGGRPANARLIQRLLAVELFDDAIAELREAQRSQGTSPLVEATIAYARHRQGEWRPAINALRRTYPQFMAAGGERLPVELLRMIYPMGYWDLIRKYAARHDLDPHLMAALICQESTFQADARSAANARGLMQILPSTGRRYASRLGIRPFTTARLHNPEVNIRIGMAYFADLRDRFGHAADALAAYNAGENRVSRWREERPGLSLDEFIDDIPFPETQTYVKRVLGSAQDYRFLYGAPEAPLNRVSAR
jgi:soluble lytic murein transglycosylase